MNFKSLSKLFGVATLVLVFFSFALKATAATPSSVSINTVPANPAPSENTNITLSSYANNLDTVLISWFVDGKAASSGTGKKSFSFKAPAAGSQNTITATILLPDGLVEKTLIIRPASLALLWQATGSYVPPFYRGKALPSAESEIKVVAIPEIRTGGVKVSPKNMTYEWKKDYNNMPGDSGYGKNFFYFVSDYLDDSSNVSATASTVDGGNSSSASVAIGTFLPKLSFYKQDEKTGTVWEHTLNDSANIEGSATLVAVPYYISVTDIRIPTLVWRWSINGLDVATRGGMKNILPLQAPVGTSGTSKVKLEIENSGKIFESVSKEINVNF
ncbi:MAG TPA: hypothetical protein VJB95_01520 [Candidatus Paceibacterota bacterium]